MGSNLKGIYWQENIFTNIKNIIKIVHQFPIVDYELITAANSSWDYY
jgi:hypothetical protein